MLKLYFKCIALLYFTLQLSSGYSQPNKGEFVNVSVGFGTCGANDESEIDAPGFYAQAEYVWSPLSWFGVRPYAGVLTASGEVNEPGVQKESIK
jgi:hypothetical protein